MTQAARQRAPYKIQPEAVWDRIRESYMAGAPRQIVAERYGVTVDAIKNRARRGGWAAERAVIQAGRAPEALGGLFEGLDTTSGDPGELARAAVTAIGAAMRQGRLAEAKSLAGLAESLSRLSIRAPKDPLDMVVDALLNPTYAVDLLAVWDDENPHPAKKRYWDTLSDRVRAEEKRKLEAWRAEQAAKGEACK